jgi:hypothetical protein
VTVNLNLCAYWSARQEALQTCAERLARFVELLAEREPLFKHWYKLGRSRAKADQPIDQSLEGLRAVLEKGQNRRDVDRSAIPELGYRFSAWNRGGSGSDEASLAVVCGSWARHPGLKNSVVLTLPRRVDYTDVARVLPLFRDTVSCWGPDSAIVCSNETFTKAEPYLDWLLFMKGGIPNANAAVALGSRLLDWGDLGQCVILQDKPVDWSNPSDVQHIEALRRALFPSP